MGRVSFTTIQKHGCSAFIIPLWTTLGKEIKMRAMLCGCNQRLEATDDEEADPIEESARFMKYT